MEENGKLENVDDKIVRDVKFKIRVCHIRT